MAETPKNPSEYGYRPNDEIVITGAEFRTLQNAVQRGMANGTEEKYIQKKEWVNVQTGKVVAKPTKKQKEERKVVLLPSEEKTLEETQIEFNSNLFPEIFQGNKLLFQIHMRNIENGVATHGEVLKAEMQKAKEEQERKGTMKKVEDEEPQTQSEGKSS